jgi:cystathionine beta-lyase/cystathionine gamma-synthase
MKLDTLLAQAGSRHDPHTGAIAVPIVTSSAFQHPGLGESTGFDYSRTSNPTRQAFEQTMAELEGGAGAAAFASGLSAIDAVLRLFKPGDKLVVTEDIYGGTIRLFERFGPLFGLEFIFVDSSDTEKTAEAMQIPGVRGLFVEIPTNPLLKVPDLKALGELSRERQALFIVDNTFLTPVLCRPLEYGADLCVYSATKYLGGHHDLIGGVVVSRTKELAERTAFIQNAAGAILGPFESWLLLRSLQTLTLRMKKHGENALAVARFLQNHPRIKNLHYPGLPADPGYKILLAEARGSGGIISFEVESPEQVKKILSSVRVFIFAESLGGAGSLITFPKRQTHEDMAPELQKKLGITDCLLRLSIGLEDAEDLLEDLHSVLG